jgi:tRNA(Ile)-lysidine synthase
MGFTSECACRALKYPHPDWMYHNLVHAVTERVLDYIRSTELLRPGDRVGVAVSGGCDSVALLRILLELRPELGVVLSILHFNHKLRGAESDGDETFVAELARKHKLEFKRCSADVRQYAAKERISIETAARQLRRDFFMKSLGASERGRGVRGQESPHHTLKCPRVTLDKVATGHTLDDQAETVLMRVIRGTGGRGLAGIYPRVEVVHAQREGAGAIVRPLLIVRRRELEDYLKQLGQQWREDSTNKDLKFTRNRVRHVLLPLLEKEFNPAITETLAELAQIARAEQDYWEHKSRGWIESDVHRFGQGPGKHSQPLAHVEPSDRRGGRLRTNAVACLRRTSLLKEPLAMQRQLIKSIAERAGATLEFNQIEEGLHLAAEERCHKKELDFPGGWKLVREDENLMLVASAETTDSEKAAPARSYEYQLHVPGSVDVPELGSRFEAVIFASGSQPKNPDDAVEFCEISSELTVRNWRAGDRFWPAHRKRDKKVKEWLTDLHVCGRERQFWPVIVRGNEIIWMRGLGVGAKFVAHGHKETRAFFRESPITG